MEWSSFCTWASSATMMPQKQAATCAAHLFLLQHHIKGRLTACCSLFIVRAMQLCAFSLFLLFSIIICCISWWSVWWCLPVAVVRHLLLPVTLQFYELNKIVLASCVSSIICMWQMLKLPHILMVRELNWANSAIATL